MITQPEVTVVATGTANTASVLAAFRRLGTRPKLSTSPAEIASARFVVLPGVGAFGPARKRLSELDLDAALGERITAARPLLGICLGMQLLFESSEETPGVTGLAAIPGNLSRFAPGPCVPQLGWNQVVPTGCQLLEPGDAYFANTYKLDQLPSNWAGATTDYGGDFVSAVERGPILACQFHPELSGAWGERLLARWIERGMEVT